jgi:membrane protein required for beta-lactamase induction
MDLTITFAGLSLLIAGIIFKNPLMLFFGIVIFVLPALFGDISQDMKAWITSLRRKKNPRRRKRKKT